MLSLCEPLAATLLAAVMLGQLLGLSQLLGGALLLGAGIAVQTVPARPARRARDDADPPRGTWRAAARDAARAAGGGVVSRPVRRSGGAPRPGQ